MLAPRENKKQTDKKLDFPAQLSAFAAASLARADSNFKGRISLKKIDTLGKILFDGITYHEVVSPLLAHNPSPQLDALMELLDTIDYPKTISNLATIYPNQVPEYEQTESPDIIAIILKRDDQKNILEEVLFYQGARGSELYLHPRDRVFIGGKHTAEPKYEFRSDLWLTAVRRTELRHGDLPYGQRKDLAYPNKRPLFPEKIASVASSRLRVNPIDALAQIAEDLDTVDFETSQHYAVAVELLLAGRIRPTLKFTKLCSDRLVPDLRDYVSSFEEMGLYFVQNDLKIPDFFELQTDRADCFETPADQAFLAEALSQQIIGEDSTCSNFLRQEAEELSKLKQNFLHSAEVQRTRYYQPLSIHEIVYYTRRLMGLNTCFAETDLGLPVKQLKTLEAGRLKDSTPFIEKYISYVGKPVTTDGNNMLNLAMALHDTYVTN